MATIDDIRARKLLLAIPLAVYILSYIYLAFYHNEIFLFKTIIHEGGTYNFLETLFYATHFVGHIPVHTVLALYFSGIYLCMNGRPAYRVESSRLLWLSISLVLLISAGFLISFLWFGTEDTISFLLQKKQSVTRYEQGGSWNLHLPSTMMQFLLIPIYIYLAKWLFKSPVKLNFKGVNIIVASVLLCIFMTWLVNDSPLSTVIEIWKEPRYLAHSVRELATFPVTYYPFALYFMLNHKNPHGSQKVTGDWTLQVSIITALFLFTILFAYQSIIPLMVGIGNLAQNPDFAKGGELSILYLLSSHYFEHFLESLYFILMSLLIYYSIQNYSSN